MSKSKQNEADSLHEWKSRMADFLLEKRRNSAILRSTSKASELVGMREVIRRKIEKGLPLWEVDKVWLKNNLK